MRYVLIHYHIFKNAGSTLEIILDRNFGENWVRYDDEDPNAHVGNLELLRFLKDRPQLMALSSHQLHYPKPVARDYVFFDLCFLRDPIDRIRSIYHFFRRAGQANGDSVQEAAGRCSLGEFISYLVREHPPWINDAQVNQLAAFGVYSHPATPRDLETAIERVWKMSFPGVVDMFDESLIAGQYFTWPLFPFRDCSYRPMNVNSAPSSLESRLRAVRDQCGRQVFKQLMELNRLDMKLVEAARNELRRRFRIVPDHDARLKSLREAVALQTAGAAEAAAAAAV